MDTLLAYLSVAIFASAGVIVVCALKMIICDFIDDHFK